MSLPPGWKDLGITTEEQFQDLIKAHAKALKEVGREGSFEFMGETLHVGFAGYLIEYIQDQIKSKDSKNVRG